MNVRQSTNDACDMEVRDLNKSFGDKPILRDFNLKIRKGETFVILGPSGSGKSVFLKHLAGLIKPDSGEVHVLGRNIHELPPDELLALRMHVGMVFQSSALFNSLTVAENVALALMEHKRVPPEEVERIVEEKLALVSISGANDLLPEQISGGMKKRVAVARTLALEPEIILFDEPTSGLDPIMARNVDELILDLKRHVGLTSVVVSHDLISAFTIADRIGMIHQGRIVFDGTPQEFRASKDEVIQDFIRRDTRWRSQS